MSTTLGREFQPILKFIPPHMSPEDYQILKRYALTAFQGALRIYYDVGLGLGAEVPRGTPTKLEHFWTKVTQKRADMIIEYEDSVKIVELRYDVTSNAVGRLLTYEMLWKDDPAIKKPYTMALVSNRFDPEIERISKAFKIEYLVV